MFAAAFAALLAFAGWSLSLLVGVRGSWTELGEAQAARVRVDRVFATWRDLNRPGNDVLERYEVDANRAAFARYEAAYRDAMKPLEADRGRDPAVDAFLATIAREADDMNARTAAILDLAAARQRLEAAGAPSEQVRAQETAAGTAMAQMDQAFQRGLDGIVALNEALSTRTERLLSGQQAVVMQLAVMLVVALVASALAVELLRRRARQQLALSRLTEVADRIVRDGDLTQTIEDEGADAVGRLAGALRSLLGRMREIPDGLREPARTLSAAVRTVSAAADFQVESSTRQAVALQETQVTAEEIRQTSKLAAEKADAVSSVLAQADELARAGEEAVEQTLTGLTDIRTYSQDVGARVQALGDKSRLIAGITQTVKDLADQSNMLALNAAIEAARSGEHGRGFAVVAREIRSLADQSIEATRRVAEILEGIGAAVAEAVEMSDRGKERMEAGIVQVRTSGESLRELSALTREVASATRQIAAAVGQQNAGINQIFSAVSDQTKMMDETVARVRGVRETVGSLEQVAGSVSGVVESFRV